VETTYVYDALNRNTTTNYSDTTVNPDVKRFYDAATNGKGRFGSFYSGGDYSTGANVDHTAIDSYDALGRPLVQRQLFKLNNVWSPTYQTSRAYNRAGGVTLQTYPSGHSVTYNYDQAGRVANKDQANLAFTGTLGDGVLRTYAAGITYSPWGSLSREQYGTSTPVYNKLHYNIRGQLCDVRASNVNEEWSGELGALVNHYSTTWQHCGSGTDNNGNVLMSQTIINSYYMEDRYTYDALNRLTAVNEWQNGATNTASQQYDYDRWGNRTIKPTSWGIGINTKQFTVDTATNRLSVPSGQSGVMTYDFAGNLITDTYTGAGSREYDAENRMTRAWGGNNQWQSYTYNADGQRVRRKSTIRKLGKSMVSTGSCSQSMQSMALRQAHKRSTATAMDNYSSLRRAEIQHGSTMRCPLELRALVIARVGTGWVRLPVPSPAVWRINRTSWRACISIISFGQLQR
jgi:YD repeat-containing protein